jgi:xylose isomerase
MNNLITTRLNSFKARPELFWGESKKPTTAELIQRAGTVSGLTAIELNYPQHFEGVSPFEVAKIVEENGLKISGLAMRYDEDKFANGAFINPDPGLREEAIQLTIDAAKLCSDLGAKNLTIWSATDGFDYPFQLDYEKAWELQIEGLKRVAKSAPDVCMSIEYKPKEPRRFALLDSIGTTLLAVNQVNQPNLGVTLDFCHLLMKNEYPAYSVALAITQDKLVGVHLNDGYGQLDDGLMLGSVNFWQTLEVLDYLKKQNYQGTYYFDTFPLREDPVKECEANIQTLNKMLEFLDGIDFEELEQARAQHDAIKLHQLFQKKLAVKL